MNALLAILNVFIDPAETVRRIKGNKLAWLPPVLVAGLIMAIYNLTLAPMTMQALRNDPPPGLDPAKLDQMMGTMQFMSRFSAISAPVMFALMTMIGAAVIFAACVILQVNLRFPDLYNLLAHVGLINALQALAHFFVLRSKGSDVVLKELVPNFGLDMFVSESAPKMLHGVLIFFSVFTIWHIVILAIGVAALAQISKGKAFLVTSPSWIVGLIFAVIGALFR
ncbi:MAG: YIP1 family protein [Acidobacteria bacterium]|nr:YIP1 family protein [Acidobacteriota bacterium]